MRSRRGECVVYSTHSTDCKGATDASRRASGGLGHGLPCLLPDFRTATALAVGVVLVELAAIAWIRHRFIETPLLSAAFQVVVGGLLVLGTGVLIGSS
jgi:erythrin-vacuolar iron transport family protein